MYPAARAHQVINWYAHIQSLLSLFPPQSASDFTLLLNIKRDPIKNITDQIDRYGTKNKHNAAIFHDLSSCLL